MKRVLITLLVLLCVLSLTACSTAPTQAPSSLSKESIAEAGFLVLVNQSHLWPEGLIPENMVNLYEKRPSGLIGLRNSALLADETAFSALCLMVSATKEAGFTGYTVIAAYRDYEEQRRIYERNTPGLLQKILGRQNVAVQPGASEHHTGLAFDLGVMHGDTLEDVFANTAEGEWVLEHCWEYGFIQRYPKGKSQLTGVVDEGWHFRYVGAAAEEIYANGLCLEEYLQQ